MLPLPAFALASLALLQVGPFTRPGPQPASQLPPEVIQRQDDKRRQPAASAPQALPAPKSELDRCLALVAEDPLQGIDAAQAWLRQAKGVPASQAGHCLGVALGRLERWSDAESALLAARDALGAADPRERARLGAMAGNAALARGAADAALTALDPAHAAALSAGDKALAGQIAIDRARALVALGRSDDAGAALAEARGAVPGSAEAWLLSATLSRRTGKLAEAQAQIEKAAALLPVDPEIGLEAGVIAMLSGHEDAARKSWQSVVAAAPGSAAATTARGYLAQIAAPATAAGTPVR